MWDGLGLMFWGYFKKVVIADRLAIYVNEVYNNPGEYHGLPLILATYFFAFQIYCDFSGYSDIAIGSARVLSYELMQNFNRPYASKSIPEFWRRWHISLSTWFKDYLYIPLGGNRVSKARWYYNIFVVFLLSGLWHGANWTFLLWGSLHGAYMVISSMTKSIRFRVAHFLTLTKYPMIHNALRVFITFHLVLFSWICFRSNSISDLFIILKNMFLIENLNFLVNLPSFKFNILDYTLAFTTIIFMELVQLYQSKHPIRPLIITKPTWVQWSLYSTAILTIIFFGAFHSSEFIYFQF